MKSPNLYPLMKTNLSYTQSTLVTPELTASAMGSGELEVLATPALVALMEHAARKAVADELPAGSTTVGGEIRCKHLRPTAVGKKVTATATLTAAENDRKLSFHITAEDENGPIGEAEHTRFVVDSARFMSKLL